MDNLLKISNNYLLVEVCTKAAEVHTFKSINDNYNYVWSGDEKYWKGRNPILFPQVSNTDNKTTLINGISYPMGNHGFARNCVFNVDDIKDDELTLSLSENEETLKQYPFKFKLTVNYKLVDKELLITYKILNNSDIKMPYGFGLHPAFACPVDYKNTRVVFEKEEEEFGKEIVINKELFEKYPTVVINSPKSTSASLVFDNRKITVKYDDFKIFAIWSQGPFVCLEPWMNHIDKDHTIEMKDRVLYKELSPKEEVTIKYSWQI